MSSFVRVEVDGGVGRIRLDRPPVNASNSVVHRELLAAAEEVARRTDIRAVVLYGGEGSFAAGADIKEMADLGPSEIAVFGKTLTRALDAVARLPQPVVAAVTGYALGGGCELALAADFRIVAEDCRIGLPETTLGVIPGAGGTQRLPRLVGVTKAKELIFTGRAVSGTEAAAIGLASKAVPRDRVLPEATDLVECAKVDLENRARFAPNSCRRRPSSDPRPLGVVNGSVDQTRAQLFAAALGAFLCAGAMCSHNAMDDYWNSVDMDRQSVAPERAYVIGIVQKYQQRSLDLKAEVARLSDAGPWSRMWTQRRRSNLQARLQTGTRDLAGAIGRLGAAGVGSTPSNWGVFSGVPRFHLEATLLKLSDDESTSAAVRAQALRLLRRLPQLRLDTYADGTSMELAVQAEVLALAATVAPSRMRALVEHLPGDVRPLPTTVDELLRSNPPITMFVSSFVYRGKVSIKLADIVVPRWLAGRGLGTAALIQLCRYADQVGASVTGTLNPGPGYDDLEIRLPRLASWYARHGFTVSHAPGEECHVGSWISRVPAINAS